MQLSKSLYSLSLISQAIISFTIHDSFLLGTTLCETTFSNQIIHLEVNNPGNEFIDAEDEDFQ